MKAMIFAAGLGTRLLHHTADRPKALVEVGGIPLLGIHLRQLQLHGFREVVVNVHHYADMVEAYLRAYDAGDLQIHISDERDLLRDTGGGLIHALPLLEGQTPIYLCNVDVLSDLDPQVLMTRHIRQKAWATLGLLQRDTSRLLSFDAEMHLRGWVNRSNGEQKGNPGPDDSLWAFCGLHVVSPELIRNCVQQGVFSVIDLYLAQAHTGRIMGQDLSGIHWLDVGKPAELAKGAELLPHILPNMP